MDIREVSAEEKRKYIDCVGGVFTDIRRVLETLEVDMESEDLIVQASAVWIGGNLCAWFNDFMTQIKEIEKSKQQIDGIKNEVAEASNAN
jgi:hypothetical protein